MPGLVALLNIPPSIYESFPGKIDDILVVVLGGAAAIWLLTNSRMSKRSLAPVVFIGSLLALKTLGAIVEWHEAHERADNIGSAIILAIAVAVTYYLYKKEEPSTRASK